MVNTNHQIVDGPRADNRHKIATSSEIDGATCGGDLLPLKAGTVLLIRPADVLRVIGFRLTARRVLPRWRRDPDQNDKQHDCDCEAQPPHHQLAGTCAFRVRQIVNEAQHQLAGFLVARQIVHGLPPDCLLGKGTRSREVTFRANLFRVNRFLRTTQTRQGFRNSSGNLAIFAATRRALSFH